MTALEGSQMKVSENVSDLWSPKSAMLFQKNVVGKLSRMIFCYKKLVWSRYFPCLLFLSIIIIFRNIFSHLTFLLSAFLILVAPMATCSVPLFLLLNMPFRLLQALSTCLPTPAPVAPPHRYLLWCCVSCLADFQSGFEAEANGFFQVQDSEKQLVTARGIFCQLLLSSGEGSLCHSASHRELLLPPVSISGSADWFQISERAVRQECLPFSVLRYFSDWPLIKPSGWIPPPPPPFPLFTAPE